MGGRHARGGGRLRELREGPHERVRARIPLARWLALACGHLLERGSVVHAQLQKTHKWPTSGQVKPNRTKPSWAKPNCAVHLVRHDHGDPHVRQARLQVGMRSHTQLEAVGAISECPAGHDAHCANDTRTVRAGREGEQGVAGKE